MMANITDHDLVYVTKKHVTLDTGIGFNAAVSNVYLTQGNGLLMTGYFTQYKGVTSNKIAKINSDGTVDPSFVIGTGFNNDVNQSIMQPDGKLVCVGDFSSYNGVTANRIVRLNTDGTIDTTFNTGTGIVGQPNYIIIDSNGKFLICGGGMTSYNGHTANRLIRLNQDGTVDTTFTTGTGSINGIFRVAEQADGKLVISGNFVYYNGIQKNYTARLNTDGTVDSTFITGTGFDSTAHGVSVIGNKILYTGNFTSYNGSTANRIVLLNSDGSIDQSFNPGTGFNGDSEYTKIFNNQIYVVHTVATQYNGTPISHVVRLNLDGSLDSAFNITTTFSDMIYNVVKLSDTRYFLMGRYQLVNGQPKGGLIKVDENGIII
jgi:uncharacterized delta-60 repeat protein